MKYAMLIGDGMADWPIPELGNKTPLEYAHTPHMDTIAVKGSVGLVQTVPSGMKPGSDVANLSLMGYDPMDYYNGRAPIEAASMGVSLKETDTAFRCNLVTILNEHMVDYSAGHISTDEARQVIDVLERECSTSHIHFFTGTSYRHLMVYSGFSGNLDTIPPHDITGKPVVSYLPKGEGAEALLALQQKAHEVLAEVPINKKRVTEGKPAVTDIWLWGEGTSKVFPTMPQRFGITGSVISAVHLIMGLGVIAGLQMRIVAGATGHLGTNYAGKVAAAKTALEEEDFVYLHVEAPDETGHEGDLQKKIQAIEEFDTHIVGEMLSLSAQRGDVRILVAPDHPTPIAIKTHSSEPVPFTLCGPGIKKKAFNSYSERSAQNCPVITGPILFNRFIKQDW